MKTSNQFISFRKGVILFGKNRQIGNVPLSSKYRSEKGLDEEISETWGQEFDKWVSFTRMMRMVL